MPVPDEHYNAHHPLPLLYPWKMCSCRDSSLSAEWQDKKGYWHSDSDCKAMGTSQILRLDGEREPATLQITDFRNSFKSVTTWTTQFCVCTIQFWLNCLGYVWPSGTCTQALCFHITPPFLRLGQHTRKLHLARFSWYKMSCGSSGNRPSKMLGTWQLPNGTDP